MRKSLERRQSETGRGDGEQERRDNVAGGFRRSEHSSAEDEERGLVARVPCASSRLTEGTLAWWNLDVSLD